MRRRETTIILSVLLVGLTALGAHADSIDENWPTWRGPRANGVALKGDPPVNWSESQNIKWKVKLPGMGSSTPVIWEDKIFIQTAELTAEEPQIPDQPRTQRRGPPSTPTPTVPYKFNIVCLDRQTGKLLWERTAREAIPHEGHHLSGTFASYSPITDGEYVWASFGSRGLHCYDVDGNHKWSVDLIKMRKRLRFGEGSSPVLAGNAIIVVMDHEDDSKIFAFNKNNGDLIWEKDRDEGTSWATPLVVTVDDALQVITSASSLIRSYDVRTGDLIWQCGRLTSNVIPSPVVGFGNVYCMSGHRGYALLAIELGHTGDLTGSDAIVWEIDKGTPYVASSLLYGERLYVLKGRNAVLSCYEAQTGKPVFEGQELDGMETVYASLVGAAGRIYIADRNGTTTVIKQSDVFEVLATNTLDDGFDASPVVKGDELYLKGNTHLYCIAKQ